MAKLACDNHFKTSQWLTASKGYVYSHYTSGTALLHVIFTQAVEVKKENRVHKLQERGTEERE